MKSLLKMFALLSPFCLISTASFAYTVECKKTNDDVYAFSFNETRDYSVTLTGSGGASILDLTCNQNSEEVSSKEETLRWNSGTVATADYNRITLAYRGDATLAQMMDGKSFIGRVIISQSSFTEGGSDEVIYPYSDIVKCVKRD